MNELSVLVIGAGYLGARAAHAWQAAGHRVTVTSRSTATAATWRGHGFDALVLDVTQPHQWPPLPQVDQVLYAVGYDRAAGATQRAVYVDGLRHVLHALPIVRDRWIYISSTGVYGQEDGAWVDEQSECRPSREGGQVCLAAEQVLQASAVADRAVILRLAGLYGPGRLPHLDRLRAGEMPAVDPSAYLNLVHVDDAVGVVQAAARSPLPETYVVADGAPVRRADFYAEVARQLGLKTTFQWGPTPTNVSERSRSSKRVRPLKLQQTLSPSWRYATYREGIAASLGHESS